MSTQYFERDYGYGPASLRPAMKEGREYIATDTLKHTLDANDKHIELNPSPDWNESNSASPAFISNKPDVDSALQELERIRKIYNDVRLYGVLWDKTSSAMTRIFDAAGITTDTTNFVYSGTVNENYSNPFDNIYPWKECKQCNVDLAAYNALSSGDDIRDAVIAWCGDYDFTTDGSNGFVGRYTPEFWYYGYEDERGKIVIIADKEVEGFYHHKPSIRSHGFAVDDGNGGLTSNDGQALAGTNLAVSTIHSRATSSGFTLMNIYDYDAEAALYLVEFANLNAQAKLGDGCSNLYSAPNTKCIEAATGATSVLAPKSVQENCIPGAALWLSSTNGDGAAGDVRTITSVEDYDSTYCKINFTPAKDLTTSTYISVMGKNNADSIGNKSGYIGVNGKNNAWYRGAIMYANRWAYILGAYRETGTNHLWLCPESLCDNYDAINTSDHIDTGIEILTPSSNSWQQVGDFTPPHGLAAFGPITKAASVVGDQQYTVVKSTASTVALLGGAACYGSRCGVLCAFWSNVSSYSHWDGSAAALLPSK